MKKTKVYILSLIIPLTLNSSLANDEVITKGFRLPEKSIEKDFTLMSLTPDEDLIKKYIKKSNSKIDENTRLEIAKNILKVSECFKIDPWILTGLIKKESTFNRYAVSPTKAAGLTQFTGIGIEEVNDQLGMRGEKYANRETIEYFNSKIKECINPTFKPLWDRVSVNSDDNLFVPLAKKEIMNDIELAITYGGVLLKTYIAYSDLKSDAKLSQIYFDALKFYNGEPGEAKVNYARAIFNNLEDIYPKKVNFNY